MVIIARSAAVQNAAALGTRPLRLGPGAQHARRIGVHREERLDAQLLQRNVLRRAERCDHGEELKGYCAFGKRIGAAPIVAVGILSNRAAVLAGFTAPQWLAGIYLGAGGGALAFILWVTALQRTTPTRVASTMTVNPIAAALLASPLVGEPIRPNLIGGHLAVFAGIWLATTEKRKA